MTNLNIPPKKTLVILLGATFAFMFINLVRLAWVHIMGPNSYAQLWSRFDLDVEQSVPTWFSCLLLIAAVPLLCMIASEKKRLGERFTWHWRGLAVIFAILSMDEIASFHNRIHIPHYWGPFHYAWVLPAGLFVLVFFIAYVRFLYHLSPRFRWLFIIAGGIYVFGAVGMEAAEGQVELIWGVHLVYNLLTTLEETCEMVGAALFIYALLKYLQVGKSRVGVLFEDDRGAGDEPPV